MLRVAVIGAESEIQSQLLPLLSEQWGQNSVRQLDSYPDGEKLERFMRATFPRLIFVSMQEPRKAEYIARWIKQFAPGTQVAGLSALNDAETLRCALRAGMLDCLSLPIEETQLADVMKAAAQNLETVSADLATRGKIISFLPSKPGVGASSIAMNVSLAIARRISERVLLADFDLNLGLQGFLFKMSEVHSATEAAEHAHHMDEEIWSALVAQRGNLDLLGSGYVSPGQRLDPTAAKELLQFWRRNYLAICVDHSGNLERYSIDLLMASDDIILVSTPEIAPLHLAKARMTLLREYGLADKVSFVVNRAKLRDAVTKEACEHCVGLPVTQFLPNDYARLEAALFKGTHVDRDSPLGQGFEALAEKLVPNLQMVRPESRDTKLSSMFQLGKLFSSVSGSAAKKPAQATAELSPKA
jgi:pilus assembly protein CpaE